MAQHDYIISNATFPAVRTDINNALSAIQTNNSGTSLPTGAVAGQIWLDTTNATSPTLKFYDGSDSISLATINYTANTVDWLDSTVSVTGLSTTATGTVLTLSDTATTSSVNFIIDNDKEIRFREATANGTNYVSLSAPTTLSADLSLTLPSADGTSGQALVTNGSGVLSFASAGRTGAVNWDTTPKTTTVTAVSGNGYFVNTTSGAITVNLPAGVAGGIVGVSDYASTSATNNITIAPNGTDKINGGNFSFKISTNGSSITLVYVDSTRGWKNIQDATLDATGQSPFIVATGGTVLTCGDYKTHVFTGPGTFTVTSAGTPAGSNSVEYLTVAGGGAGNVGGGGAGGYRQNYPSPTTAGLPVSATSYPITVGAGAVQCGSTCVSASGSPSTFSTITSAGGGGGAHRDFVGASGGSGGGAGYYGPKSGGTGNTPPVSPPQGNNGGNSPAINMSPFNGSGGGGASAVGGNQPGGAGGIGSTIATAFFGPTAPSYGTPGPAPGRYFSGGAGGTTCSGGGTGGSGGGSPGSAKANGTTNTGGAGAGYNGGSGGSGIVAIRYKFQ